MAGYRVKSTSTSPAAVPCSARPHASPRSEVFPTFHRHRPGDHLRFRPPVTGSRLETHRSRACLWPRAARTLRALDSDLASGLHSCEVETQDDFCRCAAHEANGDSWVTPPGPRRSPHFSNDTRLSRANGSSPERSTALVVLSPCQSSVARSGEQPPKTSQASPGPVGTDGFPQQPKS
jgi:hypothetical protein